MDLSFLNFCNKFILYNQIFMQKKYTQYKVSLLRISPSRECRNV